jgi:hypothetical protein
VGVVDGAPAHLGAGADGHDRGPRPFDRAGEPRRAEPVEIGPGGLRPGQHDEVGAAQLGDGPDPTHPHTGFDSQGVDVTGVGDERPAHRHHVEHLGVVATVGRCDLVVGVVEGQRVLGVDRPSRQVRQDAERGDPAAPFELVAGRAEQRRVAAQAVHHEAPHPRAQPIGEQRHRAVKGGEHPAAVDVAHDHRR